MLGALSKRLRSRVEVVDGCWEWTGRNATRYGQAYVGNHKWVVAHRVVYEELVGPIEDGLELDHLCRNTRCVNPKHLEPVTHAENCRRGEAGKYLSDRTQCIHGHPFDEENTYVRPDGSRACRKCHRERVRRHRIRKLTNNKEV